ncbi:MAG: putative nucleotide-diphospho-sugar transferase, partial [Pseudomonadota bacterium]
TNTSWLFGLSTAYNANLADMAKITVPNMQRYADRHGMELRAHDSCDVDRSPYWYKVHFARLLFEEGFDFIFWVDTDAVFVDLETSIKQEIEDDKDLYFCVENHAILGTYSRNRINSGVFVMRNSQLARDFLDVVWKTSAFEDHDWPDQAAIIAVLGLNSMFMEEQRGEDFIDSRFHDALKIMDIRWNYCPTYADAIDGETSVHHYFGLDNISKEVCLRFEATALDMVERRLMEKAAAREIAFKSFRKLHHISEKQAAMEPLLGAYKQAREELRSLKAGPIRRVKDKTRKVKSRLFSVDKT